MTTWLTRCCASVFLLGACGTATPPPDPCTTSAAAICARVLDCYGSFGVTRTYGNQAACEARHTAGCRAELAAPASGASAKTFLDCAAAVPQLACERLLPGTACRAPAGTLPLGASCAFSSQCQSAHCTVADDTPCGVCEPRAQVGDSCSVGCEGDVVCDPTSFLCVAPPSAGTACDALHPCGAHASCVGDDPAAAGSCQPDATQLGAPCDATWRTAPDCDFAHGLACDPVSQACVAQKIAVGGRPCDGGEVCAARGSCLADAGGNPVCVTPAADAAACDPSTGVGCRAPAYCRITADGGKSGGAGTCQLPDGAVCAPGGVPVLNGVVPASMSPFVSAPHDVSLQVPRGSRVVLRNPKLVSVTYAGNPDVAAIDAYGDWITHSSWLQTVGAEYNVGLGSSSAVHLPDAAPATLTGGDVETLLADLVSAGTLPAPDADTLYTLYLEDGVTTVSGGNGTSCVDYVGYHSFVDTGSITFAYAIVVKCAAITSMSALEDMGQTSSHELIEAASDPFLDAYTLHGPLSVLGEIGDLCDGQWGREQGFVYQRIWSNLAFAAGGDPCLPSDSNPPHFDVSVAPSQIYTANAGERIDYTLTGWSSAPSASWGVSLRWGGGDFTPLMHDPWANADRSLSALSLSPPDAPVFANGTVGHVTLVVPADTPSRSRSIVFIDSFLGNDATMTWALAINVR